ncbi:unnamed protein product [Phytophthora fragariaefolia]|uniref:Unnamed protein product n=1 Tax=Phytophthora fragariaefolia TaxID=1490495 RepID=A0A9W6Y1A5_9STRA|nr:unnamed protein product [Phytophthora fragariaefolia]
MRDVLALKKLSPALQLCIQSTKLALSVKETFRGYLLDRPDEVLELIKSLAPDDITEWSHEQICFLMDDADYDPAVAARESESGLFLDLHVALTELRGRMRQACEESDGKSSVAQKLLQVAEREQADFLVLGAHGKGGPAINQVHHVPWEVLRSTTSIPILVVPPAPVNSVISKQYVFVVAVDKSAAATRCLNASLKLMRPVDILRVVHFYEKPIVGEYDVQPFEWYSNIIEGAQIDGKVDIQPVERTSTIAESLQAYISVNSAAYVVLGLIGEGGEAKSRSNNPADNDPASPTLKSSRIGRLASAMLFSPRCALCLCP